MRSTSASTIARCATIPPKPKEQRIGRGFAPDNPYAFQYHYYNNTQPENLGFLEDLRRLVDNYPGTATLGEISSEDSLATMAEYTSGPRLHMGYSFELLTDDFSAAFVRRTVEALEAKLTDGWPCWAISNHDVKRVLSRWGGDRPTPDLAKLLTALVASLRGSVCIYQGEELGLPEAEIAFDHLRDPYGIAFWPNFKGRDGCRTPMPWNEGNGAGFSTATPWLPIPEADRAMSVSGQEADPESVLNGFREFMRWRRNHRAALAPSFTTRPNLYSCSCAYMTVYNTGGVQPQRTGDVMPVLAGGLCLSLPWTQWRFDGAGFLRLRCHLRRKSVATRQSRE